MKWKNKIATLAQLTAAARVDYDDIKSLHPLSFTDFGLFALDEAFKNDKDGEKQRHLEIVV